MSWGGVGVFLFEWPKCIAGAYGFGACSLRCVTSPLEGAGDGAFVPELLDTRLDCGGVSFPDTFARTLDLQMFYGLGRVPATTTRVRL